MRLLPARRRGCARRTRPRDRARLRWATLLRGKSRARFRTRMDESPPERQKNEAASLDRHARTYDELHADSIKASGESTTYFAEYKLRCLARLAAKAHILDFGC